MDARNMPRLAAADPPRPRALNRRPQRYGSGPGPDGRPRHSTPEVKSNAAHSAGAKVPPRRRFGLGRSIPAPGVGLEAPDYTAR